MVLDSTDMDIAIAQLEAQIENLNAQINGTAGTMNVQFATADTSEQHSFRQIDAQRANVESATSAMDVGRILRTFKIKKNVEVTDNGKIII